MTDCKLTKNYTAKGKAALMGSPQHHDRSARDILRVRDDMPPYKVSADEVPDKLLIVREGDLRLGVYRTSLNEAVLFTTVPQSHAEVEKTLAKVLEVIT